MLIQLEATTSNGTPAVRQLGNYKTWTYVYIQVFGANTVRIGRKLNDLSFPGPQGYPQGLQIAQGDGIWYGWWVGDLFAVASGPGTLAEFQEFGFQDANPGLLNQATAFERAVGY